MSKWTSELIKWGIVCLSNVLPIYVKAMNTTSRMIYSVHRGKI